MRLLFTFLTLAFSLHGAERSNVIFILADDLGYDEVGGHGPRLEVPGKGQYSADLSADDALMWMERKFELSPDARGC
jgi:hypothetical protein